MIYFVLKLNIAWKAPELTNYDESHEESEY